MLIAFEAHLDGGRVAVDSRQVTAVLGAGGGQPFTLLRLRGGGGVAVRGTRTEVMDRLEMTEDIRGRR